MKKSSMIFIPIVVFCLGASGDGCDKKPTSDDIQRVQQEKILQESTSKIGMPAIKNFREKKLLKTILELRDDSDLITYTYILCEMTGKLIYLGQTLGYGLPYATQFTNPMKSELFRESGHWESITLPQSDPNGLFSPASAEGTWILMKDPNSDEVKPIYVEPRIIVSPFKLPDNLLQN